jgi:metallo-beta-lactamase family protein
MALLNFLGAIQQVTGSCYLIESRDGAKVLLECGMRQGRREEDEGNRSAFPFDPRSLDVVLVSHATLTIPACCQNLRRPATAGRSSPPMQPAN